ncbi:acVLRF1 family peptidyl-tRNA hydrolase [Amycolatopsis rhabdoformis]|uniref:AcVLRF1 family peptidyl-tRNA hydrolase n=1 Tax=Amycolatopsis rhabdoformis TaxID=1448059 RepID=A0ABZ1I9R2_9PSEU|nr:acVLRF1 family peptidyl-tRNA hydrolase [Amycolatopsis rhabdoformis]WSE31201.1 acVLRF1 family peptidyl-tRNA hydrolase [Amycolatopsis rhabdoformis]
MARSVAGGGRAVEIAPERLAGWFDRFAARNDGVETTELSPASVRVLAGNGATATATVPFGPLPLPVGDADPTGDTDPATRTDRATDRDLATDPAAVAHTVAGLAVEPLVAHVLVPRLIALLLVRLGGHSLGLAHGGRVVLSRTDRHHVQGRSAAGGWSQQRFARRRADQARTALRSAADDAVEVLVPRLSEVDAVFLGGDRLALDHLRADPRLVPLFDRAEPRVLPVPDPRRTVLAEAAERALAVEIVLREP